MPEMIEVSAAPIAVLAAENATEHAAIVAAEEEDVSWLTGRLDAHSAELAALRNGMETQFNTMRESLQANQEQARLLIEAQTRMIETLTSNLSALSATALMSSRSNPDNLPSSSNETQPAAEPIVIVEPAAAAEPNREPAAREKKRRRI